MSNTIKFKEAVTVLANEGFIHRPAFGSKYAKLFNKHGECIGMTTDNCYYDLCDILQALLKYRSGKCTINGNFDAIND